MEKLIELLNEFEEKEGYRKAEWKVSENNQLHYKYVVSDTPNGEGFSEKYLSRDVSQAYLISSRYRFIKWLVENDKIDRKKLSYKNLYISDYGSSDDIFLAYDKGEQGIIYTVDYYESLLMLLSISDTPIEDLILYLK